MARMFGTDGVRGIANTELTCEMAYALGRAGAQVLTRGTHKPRILIGRDTRVSGDMLECALVAGILSTGAVAVTAGVIPTPGIAYLTQKLQMDAGVVISASHNPVAYNGIKFFDQNGRKLPDAVEDAIEAHIKTPQAQCVGGAEVGYREVLTGAEAMYESFLRNQSRQPLDGLTIAMDCANGASAAIAPQLFSKLGAMVHAIHHTPDGLNINERCGSTHPQDLQALVRETGADIGLAFDGDADRLIACDDAGELVDGDVVMGLLALSMKQRGELKDDTLVVTVMSNLGLELSLKEHGIRLVKTDVGDRYVLEEMLRGGYNIGGEQSGHVLLTDLSTAGDGMQTAIALCNVLLDAQQPLSVLKKQICIYPQVLVGAHVKPENKHAYQQDAAICDMIAELETAYAGNGRVLIRPSGTEHLIRVMMEGPDQQLMEQQAHALARLMEERLG